MKTISSLHSILGHLVLSTALTGAALPLGVTGESELVDIETDEPCGAEAMAAQLSAQAPPGIRILRVDALPEGSPGLEKIVLAGEYSAEWTFADVPAYERTLLRALPDGIRVRLVSRIARRMVRQTYGGSRARGGKL